MARPIYDVKDKRPMKKALILCSILILCLIITVVGLGPVRITESALDFFFGDARLSDDSTPMGPGWNHSAALLMGGIPQSKIDRIVFIRMLPIIEIQKKRVFKEFYFYERYWAHQYPGFPKLELSQDQLDNILSVFQQAQLFSEQNVQQKLLEERTCFNRDFICNDTASVKSMAEKIEVETSTLRKQFQDIEYKAISNGQVAELQVCLPRGHMARFEIYWDNQTVAFSTSYTYNLEISGLETKNLSLITSYFENTQVPPLEVEFPEDTPQSALNHAQRKFGKSYRRVIDNLKRDKEIQSVFGRIDEIRPAKGLNHMGAWADASWAAYTFLVSSNGKQGLVLVADREKQLLYNETIYEF